MNEGLAHCGSLALGHCSYVATLDIQKASVGYQMLHGIARPTERKNLDSTRKH